MMLQGLTWRNSRGDVVTGLQAGGPSAGVGSSSAYLKEEEGWWEDVEGALEGEVTEEEKEWPRSPPRLLGQPPASDERLKYFRQHRQASRLGMSFLRGR